MTSEVFLKFLCRLVKDMKKKVFLIVDNLLVHHRPGADHQNLCAWGHKHAWLGQAIENSHFSCIDLRSLWRSRGAPANKDYWGRVNPIGPRSCYDEGKRCAEALLFAYRQQTNMGIKVGRIFNTYGPYMHPNDGRVVSNFIIQALKGELITLYGDGRQTRSFCYVDDLIELMMLFMDDENNFSGPMNMGNPGEFTMVELAGKIIELTGSKSTPVHMPLPEDDPKQRRPNIDEAKARYGWHPQVQLHDGLSKTIEYFGNLLMQGVIR